MSDEEMDEAFEAYRRRAFGAYAPYPIDAYTYFCVGWKTALMRRADAPPLTSPLLGPQDQK